MAARGIRRSYHLRHRMRGRRYCPAHPRASAGCANTVKAGLSRPANSDRGRGCRASPLRESSDVQLSGLRPSTVAALSQGKIEAGMPDVLQMTTGSSRRHSANWRSILVVADAANLIADFRVEGGLFERLICARTGPPVCDLFNRSFGGVLHHLWSDRIALLPFDVLQMFTLEVGMRGHNAVRGVGAADIKVTVPKPALCLIEHIERLCFVFFHRGDCSLKHGLGFVCSAVLGRPSWFGSDR